jgi:dihydropteroate synthase
VTNESVFPPERVSVVGVLNVTPDSFSDGGRLLGTGGLVDLDRLVARASELVAGGADVLDVGGESTRPGSLEVAIDEEISRVEYAIEQLSERFPVPVSIDTRKAAVARRALAAGASVINDVSGLAHDPELARVAAESGAVLIVGHMRGVPESMQRAPHYEDVLDEVATGLAHSIERARVAGVPGNRIVVDPGIGFGKRIEDNLVLLAHAGWFRDRLGVPVLVGPSRKAFIEEITGDRIGERDLASHAACAVAAFTGADAVRVHDAAGARRAVAMGRAIRRARRKGVG